VPTCVLLFLYIPKKKEKKRKIKKKKKKRNTRLTTRKGIPDFRVQQHLYFRNGFLSLSKIKSNNESNTKKTSSTENEHIEDPRGFSHPC
jgi:hypothetical protein